MKTSKESILARLYVASNGTSEKLYSKEELNQWAMFYTAIWDDRTNADWIAKRFVEDHSENNRPCRRCCICGNLMNKGYVCDAFYCYCSDKCLHEDFTPEEWLKECDNNGDSYYTEWY